MARAHPTPAASMRHRPIMAPGPALFHAAWITAAVAVCLALCTIHSRKPSSSSSRRRAVSSRRGSSRETNGTGSVGTAAAGNTPAKVSPTPSDAAAKANGAAAVEAEEVAADHGGGGPVTVIDVGTHGPIAPAFLPPDPVPPRRSLSSSVKHIRFAERLGRIRSMRRGGSGVAAAAAADDDDVFLGCRRGAEVGEEGTLWTKTIILGERCRVPSAGDEDGDGVDDDVMVPWKSYRPRQPRSVPVTRSNSFAGVGSAGACRPANPRF